MKRPRLRKIKHKLFLSYGIILLVMCAVMCISYAVARGTIKSAATESFRHSLYVTAQEIEGVNSDISQLYDLIYNSSDVRDYINRIKTSADTYDRHYNYAKLNVVLGDFVSTIFSDNRQYEVLLCSRGETEVYYYSWAIYPPDSSMLAADLPAANEGADRFHLVQSGSYNPQNRSAPFLYYYRPLPNNIYSTTPDVSVVIGIRVSYLQSLYVPMAVRGATFSLLDADGEPVPGFDDNAAVRDADHIRLTAALPTMNWTIVQDVPTVHILSDLNRWSGLVILGLIVLIAVIAFLCAYIGGRISRPINQLYGDMQAIKSGAWEYSERTFADDEIGALSRQFYDMVERIRQLNEQMLEKERQKRRLEIEALQAQINPHFMYNTLGSIKMLVRLRRQDQITSSLSALTAILKSTLGKTDQTTTLEEEVATLNSYVYIQQIRYCSFGFRVELPPELGRTRILRFLLQPFVENSIFHGYDQIDVQACICISFRARRETGLLEIAIADNGRGMDAETLQAVTSGSAGKSRFSGIGIGNVIERIRLAYGEPCGVDFTSEPGKGTTVRIRLPLSEEVAF